MSGDLSQLLELVLELNDLLCLLPVISMLLDILCIQMPNLLLQWKDLAGQRLSNMLLSLLLPHILQLLDLVPVIGLKNRELLNARLLLRLQLVLKNIDLLVQRGSALGESDLELGLGGGFPLPLHLVHLLLVNLLLVAQLLREHIRLPTLGIQRPAELLQFLFSSE